MSIEILRQPRITTPAGDSVGVIALNNKAIFTLQRTDADYTAAVINIDGQLELTCPGGVDRFINQNGVLGSAVYVSGAGKSYPFYSTDAVDKVVLNTDELPAVTTGFLVNNGLKYFIRIDFTEILTTKIIAEAKVLTAPTGTVEFNANSYIQRFEGLAHLIPVDGNHSILYRLTIYEYINGVAQVGIQNSGVITAIEAKVQMGVDPNLWDHIITDNNKGAFLNTNGSMLFNGITTIDYIFDFGNIPAPLPTHIMYETFDTVGNSTGINVIAGLTPDQLLLNRSIVSGIAGTTPGGYVIVRINDGSHDTTTWEGLRLDVPKCILSDNESVLCRWINSLGAYNYYQFKNYSKTQAVESQDILPVYTDQTVSYNQVSTYIEEQVAAVDSYDSIVIEHRTNNVELMQSLISTSVVEVVHKGHWEGYIVQPAAIPTEHKRISTFTYTIELRKRRR